MPRFFISESDITEKEDGFYAVITGEDAFHITKSLRMKRGESIVLCDNHGIEHGSVLSEVESAGGEVFCKIISSHPSGNEPPYRAEVYQSLVKKDRFDVVLQKSTELGASDIYPVMTSRCSVKLDERDFIRKAERWQKIVCEASKQCGRGKIPVIHRPLKFPDAVKSAVKCGLPLFCYEGEGTVPLSQILIGCKKPDSVSLMIGPEGGYSPEEAEMAEDSGMKLTGLGKRILRTETAPLHVLSCLSLKYEL